MGFSDVMGRIGKIVIGKWLCVRMGFLIMAPLSLFSQQVEMRPLRIDSLIAMANQTFNTDREKSLKIIDILDCQMDASVSDTLMARFLRLQAMKWAEHDRDYHKALESALLGHQKSLDSKSSIDVANSHQMLGNIYFYNGDWEKAFENLYQSKELFTGMGKGKELGVITNSLSVIKSRMEQNRQAIEFAREAVELLDQHGDDYNLIIAHQNMGTFYKALGDLDSALTCIHRSYDLSLENKDSVNLAYSYGLMSDIYSVQKKYDLALSYGLKSNELALVIGDQWLVADNAKVIGDCLMGSGDYKKATQVLEEALGIAEKIGASSLLPGIYDRLQRAYAHHQDYSKAYLALNEWRQRQDSLLSLEHVAAMQKMEKEYESKINAIIDAQKKEEELKEIGRQRQLLLLAVVIIGLLMFLSALWMYARNFSESTVDFTLLVLVLLIFRFLYLFYDPFSISNTTTSPFVKISLSLLVAVVMGKAHNYVQHVFKNQIRKSIPTE